MAKKPKKSCPEHNVKLVPQKTKYGIRLSCPVEGCTVVCWDGSTSTPADYETRQARRAAHAAFDPLWQEGQFRKGYLYKKLAEYMGLEQKHTHIGHFDIDQCRQVVAFCEQYNGICKCKEEYHRFEGEADAETGMPMLVCKHCGHRQVDHQEAQRLGIATESEAGKCQ